MSVDPGPSRLRRKVWHLPPGVSCPQLCRHSGGHRPAEPTRASGGTRAPDSSPLPSMTLLWHMVVATLESAPRGLLRHGGGSLSQVQLYLTLEQLLQISSLWERGHMNSPPLARHLSMSQKQGMFCNPFYESRRTANTHTNTSKSNAAMYLKEPIGLH